MHAFRGTVLAAVACCGLSAVPASAQMMTNSTPFVNARDGFFERVGTSWGVSGRNFAFNFGGRPAVPQFGSPQAGAGATGGVGFNAGRLRGNFSFEASQGAGRSNVAQTPSVTTMNGQPGFFGDVRQSPFVISVIPVVGQGGSGAPMIQQQVGDPSQYGDYGAANTIQGRAMRGELPPRMMSALRRAYGLPEPTTPVAETPVRRNPPAAAAQPAATAVAVAAPSGGNSGPSSADEAPLSLAELRARKSPPSDPDAEARDLLEQGRTASRDKQWGAARIFLGMALRKAQGSELRGEIQDLLATAKERR